MPYAFGGLCGHININYTSQFSIQKENKTKRTELTKLSNNYKIFTFRFSE